MQRQALLLLGLAIENAAKGLLARETDGGGLSGKGGKLALAYSVGSELLERLLRRLTVPRDEDGDAPATVEA